MAEAEAIVNGGEAHDLGALLSTTERDFLVRNNGDQVKISNLHGKILGLYFSASWCGPCRRFTPNLIEAYAEIASKGDAFEVVFISADKDEDAFHEYFSKMPWLAIPFSDSETRECLNKLFKVRGIPHLVVLDGNGKVLSDKAVQIVSAYGSEGYPFTPEKINKMREDEEAAKRDQTLQSVLVSPSRDYLISNDGNKARVSELEGKIVGLYFSISTFGSCTEFTPRLAEMYRKLKEKDASFEVVLVSLDPDESSFEASFASMPWLAIPFKDKSRERLARNFEIRSIPTLLVFDSDGKTWKENVAELVEEHGVEAFPFSTEKLKELEEKEKAKLEAQTLESLLVSGELDYVLGKDGNKVPVLDLVGKNVLLYFSAEWCGPCRAFLPKLIEAYHKIKNKDSTAFEIIFISSDRDQNSFDKFYSTMPWLALPFGDERKKSLSRKFKIHGIPSLVAIGTTGRTVTKEARNHLMVHGADAYPFTEERIKELEAQIEETAKGWPEKVKHELHEHELVKTRRRSYGCDGCSEMGQGWSFFCAECDFDMHPECALEANKGEENGKEGEEGKGEISSEGKEGGYVCDGEVCRKA